MQPDAYRKLSQYRVRSGPLASRDDICNNGAFCIPFTEQPLGILPAGLAASSITTVFWVIVSDQDGWDHVSAHVAFPTRNRDPRVPTWEEMCLVKSLFFDPEESAMQLHPKASKYINHHAYVLHLWRPHNRSIPMPPLYMV